jgi:hypothetical protein
LTFDDGFILPQEQPDVEMLALRDPLCGVRGHTLASEFHHQRVFARHEEAGASRIPLPSGSPAKLVIDTAAVVAAGADDVEAAQLSHAWAEPDVHAASCHARRDRHGAPLAGARDDCRFSLLISRIQDCVDDVVELPAE